MILDKLCRALERAGVEFIDDDAQWTGRERQAREGEVMFSADTPTRIGEIIGVVISIGVYVLMAYGMYLGLTNH